MPPKRFATAPFNDWKYEDVVREVDNSYVKADFQIRQDYAQDHDHFRTGKEWVGPGEATTNSKIDQQFAPEDAIGEVISNVGNAFGEPQLGMALLKEPPAQGEISAELKARMAEGLSLLSQWWDDRKLQEKIIGLQRTAAWAGKAGLRLWIPGRFLRVNDGNSVTIKNTSDFAEALSYIHVATPLMDVATIIVDPATQDRCAVFMDSEVEWDSQGNKNESKRAEIIYLDPERDSDRDTDTILRIVYSGEEKQPLKATLKLQGNLLFSEMAVESLLTDPVIRTQRQLNLLTTLVTRIAETAAFRERYTMNAKPQGSRIPYDDGDTIPDGSLLERDEEGRQWLVTPEARTLGASVTTELVGLAKYDNNGDAKGVETPQVMVVDPVDPAPYIEAASKTRGRILRMCGQGHLAGDSNAEASGIAYEQARAVFEKDLNRRRIPEEGMLRELLTAVLAMAELITNKPGYFTSQFRVTVDQHFNAGPRSPDLVRLDLESYDASGMAIETLMTRLGVEDIDAEMERIHKSAEFILDVLDKTSKLSLTEESLSTLLQKLGVPQEIIDSLEKEPPPEPVVPTGGETPPNIPPQP